MSASAGWQQQPAAAESAETAPPPLRQDDARPPSRHHYQHDATYHDGIGEPAAPTSRNDPAAHAAADSAASDRPFAPPSDSRAAAFAYQSLQHRHHHQQSQSQQHHHYHHPRRAPYPNPHPHPLAQHPYPQPHPAPTNAEGPAAAAAATAHGDAQPPPHHPHQHRPNYLRYGAAAVPRSFTSSPASASASVSPASSPAVHRPRANHPASHHAARPPSAADMAHQQHSGMNAGSFNASAYQQHYQQTQQQQQQQQSTGYPMRPEDQHLVDSFLTFDSPEPLSQAAAGQHHHQQQFQQYHHHQQPLVDPAGSHEQQQQPTHDMMMWAENADLTALLSPTSATHSNSHTNAVASAAAAAMMGGSTPGDPTPSPGPLLPSGSRAHQPQRSTSLTSDSAAAERVMALLANSQASNDHIVRSLEEQNAMLKMKLAEVEREREALAAKTQIEHQHRQQQQQQQQQAVQLAHLMHSQAPSAVASPVIMANPNHGSYPHAAAAAAAAAMMATSRTASEMDVDFTALSSHPTPHNPFMSPINTNFTPATAFSRLSMQAAQEPFSPLTSPVFQSFLQQPSALQNNSSALPPLPPSGFPMSGFPDAGSAAAADHGNVAVMSGTGLLQSSNSAMGAGTANQGDAMALMHSFGGSDFGADFSSSGAADTRAFGTGLGVDSGISNHGSAVGGGGAHSSAMAQAAAGNPILPVTPAALMSSSTSATGLLDDMSSILPGNMAAGNGFFQQQHQQPLQQPQQQPHLQGVAGESPSPRIQTTLRGIVVPEHIQPHHYSAASGRSSSRSSSSPGPFLPAAALSVAGMFGGKPVKTSARGTGLGVGGSGGGGGGAGSSVSPTDLGNGLLPPPSVPIPGHASSASATNAANSRRSNSTSVVKASKLAAAPYARQSPRMAPMSPAMAAMLKSPALKPHASSSSSGQSSSGRGQPPAHLQLKPDAMAAAVAAAQSPGLYSQQQQQQQQQQQHSHHRQQSFQQQSQQQQAAASGVPPTPTMPPTPTSQTLQPSSAAGSSTGHAPDSAASIGDLLNTPPFLPLVSPAMYPSHAMYGGSGGSGDAGMIPPPLPPPAVPQGPGTTMRVVSKPADAAPAPAPVNPSAYIPPPSQGSGSEYQHDQFQYPHQHHDPHLVNLSGLGGYTTLGLGRGMLLSDYLEDGGGVEGLGRGGAGAGDGEDDDDPEVKKMNHKAAEQKRRNQMKDGFDELRRLIPGLQNSVTTRRTKNNPNPPGAAHGDEPGSRKKRREIKNEGKGISKIMVLKSAYDYCSFLRSRERRLVDLVAQFQALVPAGTPGRPELPADLLESSDDIFFSYVKETLWKTDSAQQRAVNELIAATDGNAGVGDSDDDDAAPSSSAAAAAPATAADGSKSARGGGKGAAGKGNVVKAVARISRATGKTPAVAKAVVAQRAAAVSSAGTGRAVPNSASVQAAFVAAAAAAAAAQQHHQNQQGQTQPLQHQQPLHGQGQQQQQEDVIMDGP
ncbi:hypothetical protein H9P43_002780 [Blastocladiella emersonii ATCC 22665]|nr:hypothetical protein H9P43_002780 [Blastocladiella emersonii ATCC 22665]